MKRILDYEGEIDFALGEFILDWGPEEVQIPRTVLTLTDKLADLLGIDIEWRGRLHIIVEVEEDSDPHP